MLGVPYAGRIPKLAAEASAAETTSSPQAQAGRVVRQEQDAAYEESLRVGTCQVCGIEQQLCSLGMSCLLHCRVEGMCAALPSHAGC